MTNKKIKDKFEIGEIHPITGKIKVAPNKWRNVDFSTLTAQQKKLLRKRKYEYTLKEIDRGSYFRFIKGKLTDEKRKILALSITERFMRQLATQQPLFPSKKNLDMSRSGYPYELSDFLEDNPNYQKDVEKINNYRQRLKDYERIKEEDNKNAKQRQNTFTDILNFIELNSGADYSYNQLLIAIDRFLKSKRSVYGVKDFGKSGASKFWEHYKNISTRGKSKF